ncbi:hypothetical protein Brms1b_009465 [Colletotrichum noveboracense]|nr:hypothetical protein Brms1b_009465 [Colletotrichum noveboracense]
MSIREPQNAIVDTIESYILVTGSTGLVGSHVVDNLLRKGYKVRAVARSKQKADAFLSARAQYASKLDFYFIEDLTDPGAFDEAVKDIDGVIHVASVSRGKESEFPLATVSNLRLLRARSLSNDLNESNMMLWRVATGGLSGSLPPCRFNFWIDVRDLAEIHVMALTTPQAGGKRYIPVAPEPFTYQKASETIRSTYPDLTQKIAAGIQEVKTHVQVDPEPMMKDFQGLKYTSFEETVTDFVSQVKHLL